jgi:hypothetical protein
MGGGAVEFHAMPVAATSASRSFSIFVRRAIVAFSPPRPRRSLLTGLS